MAVEALRAATQYNDMKGSSAADRADGVGPEDWLRQKGHMSQDEFLVGTELYVGENHGAHVDPVDVTFLIIDASSRDNVAGRISDLPLGEPVDVRRLHVEMGLVDFFALFKRFNVTLTSLDEMQGRDYRFT
ncbi:MULTISPECIES: hypothetical protein [Pseudomonas]|uniref:hypothetical protein n=1 Tax=Pseudomonas TaxID=286 RepID=UPI0007620BD5|nr:hypothetical protein [Pseudomonas monteilii]